MNEQTLHRIIGFVQLLVGLQWLLTGLSKFMGTGLGEQFPTLLSETAHRHIPNAQWYHSIVDTNLVPLGPSLITFVMIGELAIGSLLLIGAVDWFTGHKMFPKLLHQALSMLVIVALTIGIFLSWNILLVHGIMYPQLTLIGPLDKAISVDLLLILLSVLLIAADVIDVRSFSAAQPETSPTTPVPAANPGDSLASVVEARRGNHMAPMEPLSEGTGGFPTTEGLIGKPGEDLAAQTMPPVQSTGARTAPIPKPTPATQKAQPKPAPVAKKGPVPASPTSLSTNTLNLEQAKVLPPSTSSGGKPSPTQ